MKADRDDAPRYLTSSNHAGGLARWLIAGLVGVSITAGLLHLAGAKITSQPVRTAKPSSSGTYDPNAYVPQFDEITELNRSAEEEFWSDIARKESQQSRAKQTDYNDRNYTSRGAVNVVSTEPLRQSETYQRSNQSVATTTNNINGRDGRWIKQWSGSGRYYAEWTYSNNRIDGRSVCLNHKRGSVDYRECRKAAKQYYHEECTAWRARYDNDRKDHSDRMKQRYCSAASSFNPMG
ncbi:hypothetical protein [Pseudomonas sp. Marseille-Q8238]